MPERVCGLSANVRYYRLIAGVGEEFTKDTRTDFSKLISLTEVDEAQPNPAAQSGGCPRVLVPEATTLLMHGLDFSV